MTYVRIVLSGLAAIFIALHGPWLVIALKDMSHQRATSLLVGIHPSLTFHQMNSLRRLASPK